LIREEISSLTGGTGFFGTIAVMGGVTKALTAFACLQLMTAKKTSENRKLTRMFEGLAYLDDKNTNQEHYHSVRLTGKYLEAPNQDPAAHPHDDDEVLIKWHREHDPNELMIEIEETRRRSVSLSDEPDPSIITLDEAKTFIDSNQEENHIQVIDDAKEFIEDTLASVEKPPELNIAQHIPTTSASVNKTTTAVPADVITPPPSTSAAIPVIQETLIATEKENEEIQNSSNASSHDKIPDGRSSFSSIHTMKQMLRTPSVRIKGEDRAFLDSLSRDYSGKDLQQLETSLEAITMKQLPAIPENDAHDESDDEDSVYEDAHNTLSRYQQQQQNQYSAPIKSTKPPSAKSGKRKSGMWGFFKQNVSYITGIGYTANSSGNGKSGEGSEASSNNISKRAAIGRMVRNWAGFGKPTQAEERTEIRSPPRQNMVTVFDQVCIELVKELLFILLCDSFLLTVYSHQLH
jgi:hypothetical protein